MRKAWLVAASTYRRQIKSATFLILTFGLPVMMVVAGGIPLLLSASGQLPALGYVDRTGRLAPVAEVVLGEGALAVQTYDSVDAALAAFGRDEIEGVLVVPPGYLEGEPVAFYSEQAPNPSTEALLTRLLRRSLLPDQPDWVLERLDEPSQIVYVAQATGEEIAQGLGFIVRLALPAGLAMLFGLAVLVSTSQMGSAVVEEKERRAIEIIATSISIRQLVSGKVLGISLLTLTQFGLWGLGGAVALGLFLASGADLQGLLIPWRALIWGLLLCLPGYYLYGTLAAGLGVIAGDRQQASQLAGVLGLLGVAPAWFAGTLVTAPNGALAVGLSLFPLTGPMFTLLRMAVTDVPVWQMAVGLALILVSLAAAIWAVAGIFRAAMLIYGKPLRPAEIVRALRQA